MAIESDSEKPKVQRYLSINSLGEFSVKALDAQKWRDPPDGVILPEESILIERTDKFRNMLGSAQFRVYAGIEPENGAWMTLENDFNWKKDYDAICRPKVQEYADKFHGKLDQFLNHPDEDTAFTYSVVVDIYRHTLNDARDLKLQMIEYINSHADLREMMVTLL
jgi:hypothetical protein